MKQNGRMVEQSMRGFGLAAVGLASLFVGCASTHTTDHGKAVAAHQVPTRVEVGTPAEAGSPEAAPFAHHVSWPKAPEWSGNAASYLMASGTDAQGVWVEGKGYFRGTLDEVYGDFVEPQIIGPVHLTKDIKLDHFVESETATTYVMHVKMRYIMSIEFDLSARVTPLMSEGRRTGWVYQSQKTAGTRFIEKISDRIVVRALEGDWFSVEFQSLNRATMDKEAEARGHLESLFGHWDARTQSRGMKGDVASSALTP